MGAYLWVAAGSALGGMARHFFTDLGVRWFGAAFPWGTLFVNVLGSFVIGLFLALTVKEWDVSANMKLFVMTGFCGGYTTFSAFSLQTLNLVQAGEWLRAAAYILGSVVLCLAAVWAGYALGAR
jgi:CrcB protein